MARLTAALSAFAGRSGAKDIEYVFIGPDSARLAREIRGTPRAVSLGYLSDDADIASAYRAADMFVLPSLEENCPNMLLEALSSGTPCSVSRSSGMLEIMEGSGAGAVFDPNDPDSISSSILGMLSSARDRFDKMRAAARKTTLSGFSEPAQADKYIALYGSLLNM
jgi:glycosyltransferase involved in cell wall biosynthesis